VPPVKVQFHDVGVFRLRSVKFTVIGAQPLRGLPEKSAVGALSVQFEPLRATIGLGPQLFATTLRHIQGNSGIVPLFILHDALVLDVHKDMLPFLSTLCDIGSKNIPLFPSEISFPLKSSHF
jgi:hypothetical protein